MKKAARAVKIPILSGLLLGVCACASSELSNNLNSRAAMNWSASSTASSAGVGTSIVTKDGRIIEVESSAQENLKQIQSQPTDFELPFPEATYAWDRTKIFFLRYASSYAQEQIPSQSPANPNAAPMLISNRLAAQDPFLYEVRRLPGKKGLRFIVSVRTRTPTKDQASHQASHQAMAGAAQPQARLQAQNLARFIKTGTLDQEITPPKNS